MFAFPNVERKAQELRRVRQPFAPLPADGARYDVLVRHGNHPGKQLIDARARGDVVVG